MVMDSIEKGKVNGVKLSNNILQSIKKAKKYIKQKEYSKAIRIFKNVYYVISVNYLRKNENINIEEINKDYSLLDRDLLKNEQLELKLISGNHLSWIANLLFNIIFSLELALISGYTFAFIESDSSKLQSIGDKVVIGLIVFMIVSVVCLFIKNKKDRFRTVYEEAINELVEEIDKK